jgi:hypothetical protein
MPAPTQPIDLMFPGSQHTIASLTSSVPTACLIGWQMDRQ